MFSATISFEDEKGDTEKLLSFEDKVLSNGRAEYKVTRKGKLLIIDVLAKDSVALRSTLTSITRVLTINEKTRKVLEDE
jgi:tRNA threonylcarbamoyladenosine modification (KEOPS) complex  Pcc1 subunit